MKSMIEIKEDNTTITGKVFFITEKSEYDCAIYSRGYENITIDRCVICVKNPYLSFGFYIFLLWFFHITILRKKEYMS